MSQDYHQSIFSFSNGFDRSQQQEQEQHQNHIAQQIRRDKMRLQQSFHHINPPPPLVAIEEEVVESNGLPSYETAGMLSEMFNFTSGPSTAAGGGTGGGDMSYPTTTDWYGGGGLGPLDDESSKDPNVTNDSDSIAATHHHHHPHHQHHHQHQHQQQISGINATDSAVAMQLFLMNPHEPKSPSPSPSSSTLHMLLPNPSSGFHHPSTTGGGHFGPSQFTWVQDNNTTSNTTNPHVIENQRLSLSLSSSLQNLEVGKAEEMLFFNQGGGGGGGEGSSTSTQYHPYKNFVVNNQVGFGSSLGIVNGLRNSKYSKAAQELLEEFCSIGRGQLKRNNKQLVKQETNPNVPNNPSGGGGSSGGGGGNSSKDPPPLSAADRLEHQRRKVKLLSMLDEVDKRYNHYCEQMQMVVNSFDLMMGFGAAIPYTALAQKAMSRHFRCLKDAIAAQLKHSCELLGEKDAGTSGVTKGETPRLRMLEQSLRQQRVFNQMGMMEQEAWRPQRGLPERSVNILRAWLFEHFLHPYPSDADKHLLSRQTGLSRNQVSNWFINARVRLWKPMVEEMYQQESKDEEQVSEINPNNIINNINAQTPRQNTTTLSPEITTANIERSEFNDTENDPSLIAINAQHHPITTTTKSSFAASASASFIPVVHHDSDFGAETSGSSELASPLIRFGTSTGDVSLTLGLRHAGNLPEKSNFTVRDFGGC